VTRPAGQCAFADGLLVLAECLGLLDVDQAVGIEHGVAVRVRQRLAEVTHDPERGWSAHLVSKSGGAPRARAGRAHPGLVLRPLTSCRDRP
jgi:hypothetical protein